MLTIISSSGENFYKCRSGSMISCNTPKYLYIVLLNEVENYVFLIIAAVIAFFYFITRAAH